MKTICVFCGAKEGTNPRIAKLASDVGKEISKRKITVVCGGGDTGLMQILTDAALENNGDVVGIFPDILTNPHKKLTSLVKTACLASRKQKMIEAANGFLILPGGYGTLDEALEVITLYRLGVHTKPIILFNDNGFWDDTLKQIDKMVQEGFVDKKGSHSFIVVNDMHQFKDALNTYYLLGSH